MSEDKCAAPLESDVCNDCAEEFNSALDTIYSEAFFEDEIQEFAANHPDKQLEFEVIVVARVINTDCATAVTYSGPTVDSSDPDIFS